MGLATPEKVQKLQKALHAKAKGSPDYRFYLLYDKVYRADVLLHAYDCVKHNGGSAGVDGQTFEQIESQGLERWLGELTQALKTKTYRPQAVRRVWISKADGGRRPLGIPTVTDRVVQTAALTVLSPIFEADLPPEQYAYRPDRSALDAVNRVSALVNTGHGQVIDADLSGYFDSIPHAELMKSVARRISDRHVLHLIKMWLESPVEETDENGQVRRTTRNKNEGRGTPQGAPISPLLSNLYMRRFVLGWKAQGHEQRLDAHIVNYADDFVICCRDRADEAMAAMRRIMERLKLTVNEAKTRACRLSDDSFDFLGYTVGRQYSWTKRRMIVCVRPSRRSIRRLCDRLHELTERKWTWLSLPEQVKRMNDRLDGWSNYFRLGSVSKAYRAVDQQARSRLRQWLRRKHQSKHRDYRRYSDDRLHDAFGLTRLESRRQRFLWATA